MADSDQLRIFFKEICHSFKQEYQGHADIDTLIEIAIRLPVLSSEERKLQADLVLRMGSTDNATALNAVRELRNRGWLENGSLRGKVFTKANLQGVDLTRADLQGSKLNWANLKEADLTYANLQGADLGGTHFEKASDDAARAATFWDANLRDAILRQATLFGVNFGRADLRGAKLNDAKLTFATDLENAKCDENTILPDGSKWTPDTDWVKFTAPTFRRL
jgi:uncharacterized protein YjbI with pentapeptide repeats